MPELQKFKKLTESATAKICGTGREPCSSDIFIVLPLCHVPNRSALGISEKRRIGGMAHVS